MTDVVGASNSEIEMADQSTAVSLQRLEDKINSGFTALETFIAHHKHEHEMLGQMVIKAKEALDRELHALNGLRAEMDKERNLLATKDHVSQGDFAIGKRLDDFKDEAKKRMSEIEKQVASLTSGPAVSDRANKAWLAGIALAFTILGFLIKLYFDTQK